MKSIETGDTPLVFPVHPVAAPVPVQNGDDVAIRTICRSLEGMQKEAVVQVGTAGQAWRMLSDEGPWLNGTDLAPFPLAFFTAGLVSSYLAEYTAEAKKQNIEIDALGLSMDNYYAMEGSAVQDTMQGSALPVTITFRVRADAHRNQLLQTAYTAAANSPADAYLRNSLQSRFSLTANGAGVSLGEELSSVQQLPADPQPLFAGVEPDTGVNSVSNIIEKCAGPDDGFASDGAVGLKSEQKRIVHVNGKGVVRSDGLNDISVGCVKPAGSVFRFLSDESPHSGGPGRAPCSLAYLSAGLSFCFMTQLGRYAQLAKQDLVSYRISQDTRFTLPGPNADRPVAGAGAIDTHVFIDSGEDEQASRRLVEMGEQTCYLHAAARVALKNRIKLDRVTG